VTDSLLLTQQVARISDRAPSSSDSLTEPADDSLPLVPPDFSAFPSIATTLLLADFSSGEQDLFLGWSMESFTVVPEPGTGLLLGIGLSLYLGLRRVCPHGR
jgi:hypothetical protein